MSQLTSGCDNNINNANHFVQFYNSEAIHTVGNNRRIDKHSEIATTVCVCNGPSRWHREVMDNFFKMPQIGLSSPKYKYLKKYGLVRALNVEQIWW